MDASAFSALIDSLGFPIVMVVYFIWDKTKVTNQLTEAINKNTSIIEKLFAVLTHESAIGDGVKNE